eukprot:8049394-Heterocapsa_arctica.AAC.1
MEADKAAYKKIVKINIIVEVKKIIEKLEKRVDAIDMKLLLQTQIMETVDEKVDNIIPLIEEECRYVRATVKKYVAPGPWSKDKEEAEPMEEAEVGKTENDMT